MKYTPVTSSGHSSSSGGYYPTSQKQDTVFIYQTKIIQGDTVFLDTATRDTIFIGNPNLPERDTIKGDTIFVNTSPSPDTASNIMAGPRNTVFRDTVLVYQEMPTPQDVEAAQEILKKVMQDKDLTELIQETVQNMSSREIKEFRKEIGENVRDMNQQLKKERANRIVIELGAKRARLKKEREDRKKAREEFNEARDTMSKEEKKELIKARLAQIAEGTGTALKYGGAVIGGVGAAAGLGVAAIGFILGKGIIAIGKGIIKTAKAIWNWIDAHFYIKIDLSCAEQQKIKKHKKTMAVLNKKRKAKPYKGHCPGW
ncbi:MAG: hypothetical protein GY810_11555 [Aureispira sp.]|nr:hypothetical protein [Aureispira sp.]